MTNEVNYAPVRYGCNGVNVDFSFPWKIFENEDVIVQIQNKEGNISTLAYGVDYLVEFEAVGGNVKLKNVFEAGNIVIISRDVSDYQSKSFSTSPGFQASEIEKSLDRVSCNLQEMSYNIENFKETYSAEIDSQIEALENVIEENKQEVLLIQERYEDNLNNQIIELKADVDNKVETVADAADKINKLDESIALCQSSAEIASEKAEIAANKANEILNVKDELEAEIDTKANVDLSNLSEVGEKHFLNKSQITNCLLELPQNIKLDLADGILTLKAGSIVTIPNGVGVYNHVTISDDKTITQTTDGTYFVFCLEKDSGIFLREIKRVESGSTRTLNLPYSLWFDTNNNLVKVYSSDSTTYGDTASLPLGLVTVSNGAISSINQIFNGIGYIGSTVWADKGIKGLIPNGRNEDGTLNNIEFVTNAVHTQTFTASDTYGDNSYWITSSGELGGFNANIKYHGDINKVLYDVDNTIRLYCEIGRYSLDKGIITSFQTKQPFQALDYNDKPKITSWTMPSDKYIDLTLGASGSFYTAPANGYVAFQRASSGSSQQLGLGLVNSVRFNCYSSASSQLLSASIPVRAGQSFFASYQGTGETSMFRFIYSQGEV